MTGEFQLTKVKYRLEPEYITGDKSRVLVDLCRTIPDYVWNIRKLSFR